MQVIDREELERKHRELDEQVRQLQAHHGNELEIRRLKREKLRLKEQIARLTHDQMSAA
jgi:hypothetical protein